MDPSCLLQNELQESTGPHIPEEGYKFQHRIISFGRWPHLPKCFYPPGGGAIVEHIINKIVYGFLSLEVLDSTAT